MGESIYISSSLLYPSPYRATADEKTCGFVLSCSVEREGSSQETRRQILITFFFPQKISLSLQTTTTLLHPLLLPSPTPTYPTLLFHLTQLLSSLSLLLSSLYTFLASSPSSQTSLPLPAFFNFFSTLIVLAVQLSLPIAVLPEAYHQGQPIGVGGRNPEEECSLWSWATFAFMDPLLQVGWRKTLEEEEVWKLSAVQGSGVARRRFVEDG